MSLVRRDVENHRMNTWLEMVRDGSRIGTLVRRHLCIGPYTYFHHSSCHSLSVCLYRL